jgi:hypothetical protein
VFLLNIEIEEQIACMTIDYHKGKKIRTCFGCWQLKKKSNNQKEFKTVFKSSKQNWH